METEKERELWKLAKKRVSFRRHLITYLIVNALLWCLWLLGTDKDQSERIAWPIWPTLGWGIGIAFEFFSTYYFTGTDATQREYEKLKKTE